MICARYGRASTGRKRLRAHRVWLTAVLAFGLSGADAGPVRVGFGRAALPALEGAPLGGYGGLRDRRADGTLDAPEIRAVVFARGELRVALVVADLVIPRSALRADLVAATAPLELDAIVFTATHTHSGPGGYLPGWLAERVTGGAFDPEMPGRIVAAASEALAAAAADLAPAEIQSGEATLELALNRRRADGARERALPVLRARFGDGRAPLLVFAYGAHPTVLSPGSTRYSADYVGAARRWLEARGTRAVFLPGPLGDQAPAPAEGELWEGPPEAQWKQVNEIGGRLGRAVLEASAALGPPSSPELQLAERWTEPPPLALRRFCGIWWLTPLVRAPLERFVAKRVPLHALRVGDATLIALPAEPTAAVGEAIRSQMPGGSTRFVVSLSNDWLGYAVSGETFERGGYEACLSLHGPGFAPWLIAEAVETLRGIDRVP